jgi:hypothetical protein
MYGGNALGGVVNVIDNRIPRDPVTGVSGAADVSGTIGGDKGRNASGLLEAGNGTFAVHADAFVRQTSDLRIPGFARSANLRATQPLPAGESEAYGTLPNTSSHQEGGSMGGSYTWATASSAPITRPTATITAPRPKPTPASRCDRTASAWRARRAIWPAIPTASSNR